MTTAPLVIPGLTHCHCDPPRYIRVISGAWERIWFRNGRQFHVPVSKREPDCKGCGLRVRAEQ